MPQRLEAPSPALTAQPLNPSIQVHAPGAGQRIVYTYDTDADAGLVHAHPYALSGFARQLGGRDMRFGPFRANE